MSSKPDVTLAPATVSDHALLDNLLQLYIHDLSAIFGVDIGADGRFGYARLPLYWSEPETRFPFLIRVGAAPAGFALVTRGSPASADPQALDVAEFFVLRRHRRDGVGGAAARLLWDHMPGPWVVRVSEGNVGALPFWERTIRAYTDGRFSQSTLPGSPHAWRVYWFESAAPAPARGEVAGDE